MRFLGCTLMFVLTLICTAPVRAGQVIDRIVANVNGHAILQSDWDAEVVLEAFLNARPVSAVTSDERKAALDRLIDQELLREQVHPVNPAPPDVVAARLLQVRKLYSDAATEDGWRSVLARYELEQNTVERCLSEQVELMRLVEAHFRPSIQIDSRAVESYYQEQLLPELRRNGGKEVPLLEVSGQIRDLLAERKMNELIAGWIESLRSEGRVSSVDSGDQDR